MKTILTPYITSHIIIIKGMKMSYRMDIAEDTDEGGFAVSYPNLRGRVICDETVENAAANAMNAKKAWIKAALEKENPIIQNNSKREYKPSLICQ